LDLRELSPVKSPATAGPAGSEARGDYRQPEGGYRFSADSLALAHFAPLELAGRVADLGAGCGIVGLEAILAGRFGGFFELYLIEAEEIYGEAHRENVRLFGQEKADRIKIVLGDWRHLSAEALGGTFDYLIVNPPYYPLASSGQIKAGRGQGRHQTRGDLRDLFKAAKRLLKESGRLGLSWPRARLSDLVKAGESQEFTMLRLSWPPRPGLTLVLAEFRS
jgi:tRNA1Val (adenine37-N6)-methyltransferase